MQCIALVVILALAAANASVIARVPYAYSPYSYNGFDYPHPLISRGLLGAPFAYPSPVAFSAPVIPEPYLRTQILETPFISAPAPVVVTKVVDTDP